MAVSPREGRFLGRGLAFPWAKILRIADLENLGLWGKPRGPRKSFQIVLPTVAIDIRNNFFSTDLHKTLVKCYFELQMKKSVLVHIYLTKHTC